MNSRVRNVSREAFRDIFNVDVIDLRGNYLNSVAANTFESLLQAAVAASSDAAADSSSSHVRMPLDINGASGGGAGAGLTTSAVMFFDGSRGNRFVVKKILFEQNPIQCDCSLVWILANPAYRNAVSLPELCAGPKGYDCLRIRDIGRFFFSN